MSWLSRIIEYLRSRRREVSLDRTDETDGSSPPPEVDELHSLVSRAYQCSGHEPEGALADFTRALELDSGCVPAYLGRALVKDFLDDLDGALEDLTSAIKAAPEEAALRFARGLAYLGRGRRDDARGDFEASLTLSFENEADRCFARGYCLAWSGENERARELFQKSAQLDRNSPLAWSELGRLYMAVENLEAACRAFDRALSNVGWSLVNSVAKFEARVGRASVRRKLGDLEGSKSDLIRALKRLPRHLPKIEEREAELRAELEKISEPGKVEEWGGAFEHTVQWRETTDPEYPKITDVGKQLWQLRINDFPQEELYTLFVDGKERESFSNWPERWIKPSLSASPTTSPTKSNKIISAPAPASHAPWLRKAARSFGPLQKGSFRVIVDPPEGALQYTDFEKLEEAKRYADDTASESDYPPTLAWILDDTYEVIDRGMHYGMRLYNW